MEYPLKSDISIKISVVMRELPFESRVPIAPAGGYSTRLSRRSGQYPLIPRCD